MLYPLSQLTGPLQHCHPYLQAPNGNLTLSPGSRLCGPQGFSHTSLRPGFQEPQRAEDPEEGQQSPPSRQPPWHHASVGIRIEQPPAPQQHQTLVDLTNSCLSLIHPKLGTSEGSWETQRRSSSISQEAAAQKLYMRPGSSLPLQGNKQLRFSLTSNVWQGLRQAALKLDVSARAPPSTTLLTTEEAPVKTAK